MSVQFYGYTFGGTGIFNFFTFMHYFKKLLSDFDDLENLYRKKKLAWYSIRCKWVCVMNRFIHCTSGSSFRPSFHDVTERGIVLHALSVTSWKQGRIAGKQTKIAFAWLSVTIHTALARSDSAVRIGIYLSVDRKNLQQRLYLIS